MLDEVLRRGLAIDRSKTNQALWRIEIGKDGRDRGAAPQGRGPKLNSPTQLL